MSEEMQLSEEVKFLKFIVESLVDDKESIYIDRTEDSLGVLLTLTVSEDEMGRIIGKGGQVVQSIRTLLKLLGNKVERKITLKVIDPRDRK